MCDQHQCPECREGKHRNCDGYAWCNPSDTATVCECYAGAEDSRFTELHPGRTLARGEVS